MKEKVEELIRNEKERIIASEKQKRDDHLISLGLIEEGKMNRIYQDEFSQEAIYDKEKEKYYTESAVALDVTDEEYSEICKYFPTVDKEIKINYKGSGVKTLDGFGTFFFVIASLAALVAVIGFIMYLANDMDSRSEMEYAMIGLSLASSFLPIAIGSVAGGAICQGLSTIAKTALYKRTLLEKQYQFVE